MLFEENTGKFHSLQFSPSFRGVRLYVTPWTLATQASLSINNSQSLFNVMIRSHDRSWSSNLDPQTLLIFYTEKYLTFKNLSLFVLPSSLWQSFFYSEFHLFFFEIPYTWDPMVFVFLWLSSLGIIPSSSIHVARNGRISFFF